MCIHYGISWRCLLQVLGSPSKFMKTTHPNAEWAIIWNYITRLEFLKLFKLFILLSGSVIFPFMVGKLDSLWTNNGLGTIFASFTLF